MNSRWNRTETTENISFDEFVLHVAAILNRVAHDGEAITVELENGERALLRSEKPTAITARAKTEEDYAAFLASVGGWTDMDVDAFLKENDASRKLNTRPAVGL